MTIFTLWFEGWNPLDLGTYGGLAVFGAAITLAALMIFILAKAAFSAEGRSRWVRRMVTGPNGKVFWGLTFVAWAVVFGIGLQLVPHEGANSPYGGLGIIALFTGFFISMGFIWSVIGE